ncbi:MAG: TolC family protein [Candidatus Kryptoniota bacterium]
MLKFLFGLLVYTGTLFAQSDTLTLEQCLDIALKNNPQIKLAEGAFESSESSLMLSRSALLPQISGQASGTKNAGTFLFGPIARPGAFENYSAGFQAQQLIFDFGKTISRVKASSDIVEASREDLRSVRQDVALNTNIAYFNYLQAVRIAKVQEEALEQAKQHLKRAEAFYHAGTAPQFDVAKAEVDVANSKVNLINAKNQIKISRIQLENVLGKKLPEGAVLKDVLEVPQAEISTEEALQEAIKNRPSLLASQAMVKASRSLLTSAWTSNFPTISLAGGYKWTGFNLSGPLYNSWNVGVSFSIPIFAGWSIQAGIDQAKANLKSAEASNELAMQQLYLDVQQQEFALEEAKEAIDASQKLVDNAEIALKLAEGRYNSGVGSAIEVTDAELTLSNARIAYIQSLYNYRVAYARLRHAMGTIN